MLGSVVLAGPVGVGATGFSGAGGVFTGACATAILLGAETGACAGAGFGLLTGSEGLAGVEANGFVAGETGGCGLS